MDSRLELPTFVHLEDDVAPPEQLVAGVQLREGGPVGVLLHALPNESNESERKVKQLKRKQQK